MDNPFQKTVSILGQTFGRRPHQSFGIRRSDRLFHTYFIGQTGTGKSTLLLSMMAQDVEAGQGFCLVDPHGDLAQAVKDKARDSHVYWDLADPASPYGYNPLTYVQPEFRPLVASGIIDTLKQQWSDAWGPRMEHLLRYALLALLDQPGSTLADIIPLFTDKDFRSSVMSSVADDQVRRFWEDEFPSINYRNSFDGVAPIANKLGAFLAHPLVRRALCHPSQPLRFRQLMDASTPLIVNLAKGRLGTDITNVVGGLVVSMLAHGAYSRQDMPERRRRPYFLYADEFHSFTTGVFASMLPELRKYGLGLVLAHQHSSQLEHTVYDAIMGNVGTFVVFRTGARDAAMMMKQLGDVSPSHYWE